MGVANLNVEDLGGGQFKAQPVYLCCERGVMENGCVHHPRGLVFDTESPAHLAVAMLVKHLDKLGKNITQGHVKKLPHKRKRLVRLV